MDQIYIPKNRMGLASGSYVVVKALSVGRKIERPYFFNIKNIEALKLEIVKEVIKIIDENIENYDNVLFVGSFLNKGFCFNDIDVVLVSDEKVEIKELREGIEKTVGVRAHIIVLNSKDLIKGLSVDPLYLMMLSKYISKKRFIYNVKRGFNYKLLDLHLLKSKGLIDNFDILNGNEKYYLVRNMISILLFLGGGKVSNEIVDRKIEKLFEVKIKDIKENMLEKRGFLKRYRGVYSDIFNKVMEGIKNGSK